MAQKRNIFLFLFCAAILLGGVAGRSSASFAAPAVTPGVNLPLIIRSWPPTPTPTATPRPTQPPAAFLQFENPGFESGESGWETYSDHYNTLISTKTTIAAPFVGEWQAWMGRYPLGVSDTSAGYQGERSVIYQAVTIPDNAPPFYVAFQLYTASVEWVCADYPYAADDFRLYVGTTINQNAIISSQDDLIGVLAICGQSATNRWVYTWLPYDLSEFAGQRLVFKFLTWNDGSAYTHVLLDNLQFVTQLPAGVSLLAVPPAEAEAQSDLPLPFDGADGRYPPGK